jgi:hypothetical protein
MFLGSDSRIVAACLNAFVCGVQFDSWKPVESYDHRAAGERLKCWRSKATPSLTP